MIVTATDFGPGPYTGQVDAVLAELAPGVPVIHLFDDLPRWDIRAAAYLLPAYTSRLPAGSVILAVVDPGVGSTERRPVALQAGERWYVGPDNGLFELLARRTDGATCWLLPETSGIPATFHARDVFAPAAATLANGEMPAGSRETALARFTDWPDDCLQCLYVDHFGNVITGLRASEVSAGTAIEVAGQVLQAGRTFADVAPGEAFWYPNSNGLIEFAVNQGRADSLPGLEPASPFRLIPAE